MERIDALRELQILLSNIEIYDQNKLTDLEQFFTGTRTGCGCKRLIVISALNNLWEQGLKNEFEQQQNERT